MHTGAGLTAVGDMPRVEGLTEAVLRRLYVRDGLSMAAIADKFDTTRQTVHARIKEYGIERPESPWNTRTIRGLREAMGMTQEQFARSAGTSLATVGRWEIGAQPPNPENARQLDTLAKRQGYDPT